MRIEIADEFSLFKIVNSGQCFRAVEFANNHYLFIHNENVLFIHQESPNKFEVNVDMQTWNDVWHPYFDLDRDYSSIRQTINSTDIFMKKAALESAGIRILRQDPWEMLISFIISQRKNIPSIKHSIHMIAEKWGTPINTDAGVLYTFPTPQQMANATEDDLKECKVGYRASYILHALHMLIDKHIDLDALHSCDYPTIIEALTTIKGVGVKVANCIALFSYGQLSAVPIDTWIKKIISEKYAGIDPFHGYGEVAGLMQQYAFYYAQTHKEEFSHD